jgi:hypothetical protein
MQMIETVTIGCGNDEQGSKIIGKNALDRWLAMIRKSVFWGLTLVLVVVLVSLIVQSRRLEKQSTPTVTEVVKTAQSSPIRLVAPQDLKVVRSEVRFIKPSTENAPIADPQPAAELEVSIENRGPDPYINVQLRFTYLGGAKNVLESRNYLVDKPLPPGQTTSVGIIKVDDAPKNAVKCNVTIVSTDFEPQN